MRIVEIQVLSDLHADCLVPSDLDYGKVKSDLVLIPGDISNPEFVPDYVKAVWGEKVPVCVVAGNHEYYHNKKGMNAVDATLKKSETEKFHFLQNSVKILQLRNIKVRVIGATLWTDYNLYNDEYAGKVVSSRVMSDHFYIMDEEGKRIGVDDLQKKHYETRDFLENELGKKFLGPTVIMTHHCPSEKSIDKRFANMPSNAAFASNLEYLFDKNITLWVHGHTHVNHCYLLKNTLVVCNPRGYAMDNGAYENKEFDPKLTIAIFKDETGWKARKVKKT